jgi:hypothetical protein
MVGALTENRLKIRPIILIFAKLLPCFSTTIAYTCFKQHFEAVFVRIRGGPCCVVESGVLIRNDLFETNLFFGKVMDEVI